MRHFFYYALIPVYAITFSLAFILSPVFYSLFGIIVPLTLLGFYDILQKKHILLRNYPIVGHFRYLLEAFRPEIQQYFIEKDIDGRPFSRDQRSVVYQRAKGELDTAPFGTQLDLYRVGAEWVDHSMNAQFEARELDRVVVGNSQCKKPYAASRYNISAMSYGSLSKTAVLSLNKAARKGKFAQNTGEGGLAPYHLEGGGDLIWQIGTAYFGCRNPDGTFNPELFEKKSQLENVKMIELKLSQGAKPGHGGILPAAKVTDEIVSIRHVVKGMDVLSPPRHKQFSTPVGMLEFVRTLKELSGGKPVGFKLCIGRFSEFFSICKAMLKTNIYPDFITVDGAEGGTGAAPREFTNHVGTPLDDGLNFVHNTLLGFGIRQHVRIIAAGKVIDGFSMITKFALGADMCNSGRGMMMALGCIQALRCNTNQCPTGIATQDPTLYKLLDVEDKSMRVARFQQETLHQVKDLLWAMGLGQVEEIRKTHVQRRIGVGQISSYEDLFPTIATGSLLDAKTLNPKIKAWMDQSSAEKF
ncbi:MAG TPA: FMN-binding glutamate synthase family protein [Bacteriovoracaceae bacterium]|nr:FMN-binding glutamate synthase family protein [Bacteriovoracaceae bacterium]